MLLSKARGKAVVDLTTAETIGAVTGCTVAPSPAHIAGLRLKTRGRGHHTLRWEDVQSFGPDAVSVGEPDRVCDEKDLDSSDQAHAVHNPIGKAVLTETGLEKGTVMDVEFDEQSGRITHLVTGEEQILGEDLVGVGSYAVVVTAPR
ncbi:PRC-barrel domain-containing protein [Streptomyces pimonensis]|uniref:PRC-barrel domain-containing protein n=1 Tax=Streptomyces pimonensis TaxID=2860288 RepID=A0ABV4J254_9ACTN